MGEYKWVCPICKTHLIHFFYNDNISGNQLDMFTQFLEAKLNHITKHIQSSDTTMKERESG